MFWQKEKSEYWFGKAGWCTKLEVLVSQREVAASVVVKPVAAAAAGSVQPASGDLCQKLRTSDDRSNAKRSRDSIAPLAPSKVAGEDGEMGGGDS